MTQDEQDFLHWLTIAPAGAERLYPPSIGKLAHRAAVACLVARGWNERSGGYVVRLNYRIGEGLPDES